MPKILVAEDDPENIKLMKRFLAMAKFEVVFAGNGKEALDLAEKEKPDLVLMDMLMPVMDGYEATRQFKAAATLAAIPIFAVTAQAMPAEVERMRQAGCDEIVEKPIDYIKLIERIKARLRSQ